MDASRKQTKALQQQLTISFFKMMGVYLLAWLACSLLYHFVLRDRLAEYVLDMTSDTFFVTSEEYQAGYVHNYYYEIVRAEDDGYYLRSLSAYYEVRSLKLPLTITLFLLGIIAILVLLLRKSLSYFRELGDGVSKMVLHRDEPLLLSDELAIMQSEMSEMRETMLTHERNARESERRKNELVAYLAHDLRTPLTSVVGYLSLLVEAPSMPEKQRQEYLETALDKAETLDDLTDEFFEITRYNLSSIPIERDDVDITFFLEQVVDEFYPEMAARSLEASVSAPDGETFYVDSEKMARAVGNVVRNAIAYAHTGTTVEIRAERPSSGMGWKLSITNQGREIAPEHLERIFDQFMRADSARKQDGHAGLGLAIAREIVQAHGGSIHAASEGGVTTFTIELP